MYARNFSSPALLFRKTELNTLFFFTLKRRINYFNDVHADDRIKPHSRTFRDKA